MCEKSPVLTCKSKLIQFTVQSIRLHGFGSLGEINMNIFIAHGDIHFIKNMHNIFRGLKMTLGLWSILKNNNFSKLTQSQTLSPISPISLMFVASSYQVQYSNVIESWGISSINLFKVFLNITLAIFGGFVRNAGILNRKEHDMHPKLGLNVRSSRGLTKK